MTPAEALPPYSPEAERGVLGCCLINSAKTKAAIEAGVTTGWFYDVRHIEIFKVLVAMARNGGGDLVLATIKLREEGKLDDAGGPAYVSELLDAVPSAENLDYYIPTLRASYHRRAVIDIGTRLRTLAQDTAVDPDRLFEEAGDVLRHFESKGDGLPEIAKACEFLVADLPMPPQIISGVLHQGSKLLIGGSSKSYKTWTLIDLAVSVATGTPWIGFSTTAARVLYVNLELQEVFFQHRIKEILSHKRLEINDQLDVWNLRGYAADYRALVPKIRARIRDEGYLLVIIDPIYKVLGAADENSARDITDLVNTFEKLAIETGSAVLLAHHFAKGNASAKDFIDRISGSGVFLRDPDSYVCFTMHEEEDAFSVEMKLRNLPPVAPFVVKWEWPLFQRAEDLDPSRLKQSGGRPAMHKPEALLECLGDKRLTTGEWREAAESECISKSRFFALQKELIKQKKVVKSRVDHKWEQVQLKSQNWYDEKDQ
jgi:hypothetical protein